MAQDDSWWFQQKFDGRRTVQKSEGKYSGINKLGQIFPIDSRLAESLDRAQAQGFLADGEITDSRFYIWDLLSVNDTDLRIQPYEIRYVHLAQHFRGVSDLLRVSETAMTTKAKRDFVKKMHSTNAEGFVCKNRNAAYAGGRAGQHFKCKFVATASFIVGPEPEKKANDGQPHPSRDAAGLLSSPGASSFISQCVHRIDARCSPRRNQAGEGRHRK